MIKQSLIYTLRHSIIVKSLVAVCMVLLVSTTGVLADSATVGSYNINWNNKSYRLNLGAIQGEGSTGVSNAPYATNLSLQGSVDIVGPNGGYCSFSDTYQTTSGAAYSYCGYRYVFGTHTANVSTTHGWNAFGLNTTRTKFTSNVLP